MFEELNIEHFYVTGASTPTRTVQGARLAVHLGTSALALQNAPDEAYEQ